MPEAATLARPDEDQLLPEADQHQATLRHAAPHPPPTYQLVLGHDEQVHAVWDSDAHTPATSPTDDQPLVCVCRRTITLHVGPIPCVPTFCWPCTDELRCTPDAVQGPWRGPGL